MTEKSRSFMSGRIELKVTRLTDQSVVYRVEMKGPKHTLIFYCVDKDAAKATTAILKNDVIDVEVRDNANF